MSSYDLDRVQLPVLTGATLKLFARLLRSPLVGKPLLNKLVADAGISNCQPSVFPIGMQAMAKHWHEHLLLRIAWVAEQDFERRLPALHFRSLPSNTG